MKIIKKGLNLNENRIDRQVKRFNCRRCGCIFESNKDEYNYCTNYDKIVYTSKCPNCENISWLALDFD